MAVPAVFAQCTRNLRTIDGFIIPKHGDLSKWAEQGVFLLNAVLTVAQGQAASHAKLGWQTSPTQGFAPFLSTTRAWCLCFGAILPSKKLALIDATRHTILTAIHPSPLAGGGFAGCNHFALANELLVDQGKEPIDWQV